MGYREFVDEDGREWRVCDVKPSPRFAAEASRRAAGARDGDEHTLTAHVSPGWEAGWLAFHCDGSSRRLRPIPAGWETADDAVLRQLLRRAIAGGQRNAT